MSEDGSSNGLWSRSLGATLIAASVDVGVTYPLEYYKTHNQLFRRVAVNKFEDNNATRNSKVTTMKKDTLRKPPPPTYTKLKYTRPPFDITKAYVGSSAMLYGAIARTITRYTIFDSVSRMLDESNIQWGPSKSAIAGLSAGFAESIVLVPFEAIKVRLIEHQIINNNNKDKKLSFRNCLNISFKQRGIRGIYQGLVPTILRQCISSAVRLTTYTSLRQLWDVDDHASYWMKLSGIFTIASLTTGVVVLVTQPLDVVKTRMQSINARQIYANSLNCARIIAYNEGFHVLFAGSLLRTIRGISSGSIAIFVYEQLMHHSNPNSSILGDDD